LSYTSKIGMIVHKIKNSLTSCLIAVIMSTYLFRQTIFSKTFANISLTRKARFQTIEYVIILGMILLISWGVRYLSFRLLQSESKKRNNNNQVKED